jgi:hypothetical protein
VCLRNGQSVETRIGAWFWTVKGPLFHKVIHKLCGYPKNPFKYGHLVARERAAARGIVVLTRRFPFVNTAVGPEFNLRIVTG